MLRLPLILSAGLIAAAPVLATTRSEHDFELTFSAKAPKTATGVQFLTDRTDYKAPPQGQPADRVATTTFTMHPGTKTNTRAYPACARSQLEAKGPMACPEGSEVGSGEAVVITGLPIDPVVLDATIFVKKNGLLAYLTGSGQTQVIEMSITGRKIVARVPRKCLVEDDCTQGEAVLKRLEVTLEKGKLIRTPATCPKSRRWTNTVDYRYVNGDTERVTSTSPCVKG